MVPAIKICGIRTMEAVEALNELKPEYAGFILTNRFWRYVAPDTALALRNKIDPSIRTVGVFVDETIEYIKSFVDSGTINLVQLHGHEDDEFINTLRNILPGTPIIKAFKIRSRADTDIALASTADYVLLDNGTGTGLTFDWSVLPDKIDRPFFLAGGLSPENVSGALAAVTPTAVDVSSGVETDKVKDPEKMKRFVQTVREFKR